MVDMLHTQRTMAFLISNTSENEIEVFSRVTYSPLEPTSSLYGRILHRDPSSLAQYLPFHYRKENIKQERGHTLSVTLSNVRIGHLVFQRLTRVPLGSWLELGGGQKYPASATNFVHLVRC